MKDLWVMTPRIICALIASLFCNMALSQSISETDVACFTHAKVGQDVVKLELAIESEDGVLLWRTHSNDGPVEVGGKVVPRNLIEFQDATSRNERAKLDQGFVGRIGPSAIGTQFIFIDRNTGQTDLTDQWNTSLVGKLVARFELIYGSRGNLALLENDFGFGYRLVTNESYFKWPAMLGTRKINDQTLVKHAILSEKGKASFSKMPVAFFDSPAYFNVRRAWQPDVRWVVIDLKQMEISLFEGTRQ